mgnify:CR=1 FL=1
MKKVLALVLAVMMLCTMALADVIILDPAKPVETPDGSAANYSVLNPGQTIAINLDGAKANYYFDKDGKFVPANNAVTVTFAKGAELVKSQGWVKTDDTHYQYQITFKSDLTKAADKKVADIQISAISFKATGYNAVSVFKADKAEKYISYAFGYDTNELTVAEGDTSINVLGGKINVVKALTNKAGKEVATLEVELNGMTYTLTKGMKFYALGEAITFDAKDKGYTGTSIKALYNNLWNVAAKVTLPLGTDANETYKVYAKTADGKVLSVAATTTDGVMSFTVPAMSSVLVTKDTITVSGTAGTTTPGTTTNPGTGANDVVGVAAALAVVALVSGAAISLKK